MDTAFQVFELDIILYILFALSDTLKAGLLSIWINLIQDCTELL